MPWIQSLLLKDSIHAHYSWDLPFSSSVRSQQLAGLQQSLAFLPQPVTKLLTGHANNTYNWVHI